MNVPAERDNAFEPLMRQLFDIIDEGFCICEMLLDDAGAPYDYRFVATNPMFEQMTGLADAVGRTAKQLVPDLEDHWVHTYARVALQRQSIRFDEGSDAMNRWFDVFAAPVGDAPFFALVFKDATATRKARLDLEQSERRFRALMNELPLIVWVHGPDGAQDFVNQTFLDYFGVTEEQLSGDDWQMLADEASGPAYVEAFVAAVESQSDFHAEVRARNGDGEWRWLESWGAARFDEQGAFLGHIGTSADIDERKRNESELSEAAAFTERVLSGLFSFAGVLELDGTVITANQAPLEAAGLTLNDVVDRKFWECYWWSYDAAVAEELQAAIEAAAAGTVGRYDVDVQIAGGALLPIDFQIAPLRNAADEITHLVVSGLDLTERRAAEIRVAETLASERAALERAVALERVAVGLSDAATVPDVGQAVIDALEPLGCQVVSVSLERDGVLESVASVGVASDHGPLVQSLPLESNHPVAEAFRVGQPVRIDDGVAFDTRFPDLVTLRRTVGFESTHALPILGSGGEVFGVLTTAAAQQDWYTPERRSLLDAVALQMRGALERATLHEDARKSKARSDLVADVLTELEQCQTVEQQQQRLLELLVPRVADYATIEAPHSPDPLQALRHVDPSKATVLATLRRHHRLDASNTESVASAARAGGQFAKTSDTSGQELSSATRKLLADLNSHAYIVVPMSLGDEVPGALLCGLSNPARHPYGEDDLAFITEIAGRVSAIFEASDARERERRASLRLQQALLPDHVAEHRLIDTAARYQAGSDRLEVGGDWYDTFVWPNGMYGIVVGDVVGHGIEAAADMGRLRTRCEPLITTGHPDPIEVLATIEAQAELLGTIPFLTACCLVFDPPTATLTVANAGHPPPLLARSSGSSMWLDGARGPAICGIADATRTSVTVDLLPDDVVVAYSDGLVERRRHSLDEGLEWLRSEVERLVHDDVERFASALVDATPDDGEDDMIVVVTRHASSRPRFIDRIPADMAELTPLRHRFRRWLSEVEIPSATTERVLLATGEACSNAIEHAFASERHGSIQLRAAIDPSGTSLVVTVIDNGLWQPPSLYPIEGGHGSTIMQEASDRFERASGPTGTSATLHFDLASSTID